MLFFTNLFEFLRDEWGLVLLFDLLVFCGIAAHRKTWSWIGNYFIFVTVCIMLAMIGSILALNASGPLASFAVNGDYFSTLSGLFGSLIALPSTLLFATALILGYIWLETNADKRTQPRMRRRRA